MAKLGARTVVAATLRAVQLLGRQFVLGQTIAEAMDEARSAHRKQGALRFSYDMLGEGARTDADALRYLDSYTHAIRAIATGADAARTPEHNDGISIKLSALHPRYEDAQRERVMRELVPRVWQLCELAAAANLNLTIDAEEVDRLELSLDVFEALAARVAAEQPQWRGFGLALQAYQTRSLELIEHVTAVARKHGLRLMCRLVKGAYWDAEIKRAQELGLSHYPVFTHKHHSDISYLACARALLSAPDAIYPQFATHNAGTIAAILQMAEAARAPFELQRLHGMGEGVYREVMKSTAAPVRVYAPVGQHKDLLAYLVRRLLENGANSSFVNQLGDETVDIEELLMSPLWLEATNPALPLPPVLYGPPPARRNSEGLDLAVESMRAPLLAALSTTAVPQVEEFDAGNAPRAVAASVASFRSWRKTPVEKRAAMLRQAADALQRELPRFCALLVKEAFKTWGDAVAEVREAIDFLRYYAGEARRLFSGPVSLRGPTGETNVLELRGRGPFACISPWNFPLAIFTGQVAVALAAGNPVLAKPAEQTPIVAFLAARLLNEAGLPPGVLQLLPGDGAVGSVLVKDPRVAGVAFTGSNATGWAIQSALAGRRGAMVPLIAETGGLNAMIADSSALPEQAIRDVVRSAFDSAGQRCSAARLFFVQEDAAKLIVDMLVGAVEALDIGDPLDYATDIGPVIDEDAAERLDAHKLRMQKAARQLVDLALPLDCETGTYVTPAVFEIADAGLLKEEVFGPILHVVRFQAGHLDKVVAAINASGYGLTLGVHSRIAAVADYVAEHARVGNLYVNRNQIGAVVGVQPFGGEGLSGSGPKAGGPSYLARFATERVRTTDITATGGNVALLGLGEES